MSYENGSSDLKYDFRKKKSKKIYFNMLFLRLKFPGSLKDASGIQWVGHPVISYHFFYTSLKLNLQFLI